MSSKLIRGTFILTLGTIISKIIGLFYVISFHAIVGGSEPEALYQFGYVPYTLFISIATAGVPLAVSKYIAKYNALEEYAVGRKLFKSGILLMLITGIVSFLVMYVFAPTFAELSMTGVESKKFSIEDVTTVIRAVSFALIIIPVMSLIRGYFQGHQSMGPSAVSQVIEQLVRIVFLLLGAFFVLHVFHGKMVTAISVATFAAFIGGIASLFVLFWYWRKRKSHFDELLNYDKGTMHVSLREMYKEIFIYALPFVFVGIANSLYQYIDQLTFNRGMAAIGKGKEALEAIGILNFDSHKLVIIPVSLATSFSLTLVPLITESFAKGRRSELVRQVDQTFQVLLFLTVPAAIGLSLLAHPIFTVFYEPNKLGTDVLGHYAPVAILFALYSVTAAILQGINEQRFTILSLLVGLLLKLTFNIPLIKLFETNGAVYATVLGYSASIIINLFVIKVFAQYPFKTIFRRAILILLMNAIMAGIVIIVYKLITLVLVPDAKLQALIITIICGAVGAIVYGYLGLRSKLAEKLFGSRISRIKSRLHIG
ncbi:polysaccharide biosynthesis protein [Heyndrickxia sporothermodurans]|uniref:putative polysaccharide biosynthesis protein n=1 Tax=Heyndrickxia sporothermodurans TaxID=46224 RepID=UPI00192C6BE6|nr:polysaccharide biosynthesis protein [Heyndrickxia sporothermodurans]MBL5867615.1 polysaccharide biosynthesis protein [Heyndrickxia sporothermodurans]